MQLAVVRYASAVTATSQQMLLPSASTPDVIAQPNADRQSSRLEIVEVVVFGRPLFVLESERIRL